MHGLPMCEPRDVNRTSKPMLKTDCPRFNLRMITWPCPMETVPRLTVSKPTLLWLWPKVTPTGRIGDPFFRNGEMVVWAGSSVHAVAIPV